MGIKYGRRAALIIDIFREFYLQIIDMEATKWYYKSIIKTPK